MEEVIDVLSVPIKIDSGSKLLCLLGNPVGHSVSPQLQNTISKVMGKNFVYLNFKVEESNLGSVVEGLKALGAVGFNITIPYKEKIMKYLDKTDEAALKIGAVNTVAIRNGILEGCNTDWIGFYKALESGTGYGLRGERVLILGAGGSARAIAFSVIKNGAASLSICNRTYVKAVSFADELQSKYGMLVDVIPYEDLAIYSAIEKNSLIINTTSLGMFPNVANSPVRDNAPFYKGQRVFDIVFNPRETKLMKMAARKGAKVLNGLGMLARQGIESWEFFTGVKIDKTSMEKILSELKELGIC
ncbi:MAG: shikimate dehydrogenase [Clostridiales bacterium]|jgi:shikimate dehydrogenase|nr:shikimate dehydrogenase [Clostridiales bacterium]